ncbi:hypothetical protein Tco_0856324 [Tanacetum coccineum]|uniref:Uncharacterized protein n=1 Tax=Tanacetum coccineum TaxID=301880 RepID=A0ABQ5B6G8_9ASTR
MPTSLSRTVTVPTSRRNFQSDERPQNSSKFVKSLTCGASTLWARSRLHEGKRYSRSSRGLLSKWVEAKASPPMMPRIMEDCPDCEDSQFCHSSRVSHPQLHLGIRYPNLID